MQHLSMQHFSIQHLSKDKIWLFTIAISPEVLNILADIVQVWTKQSNFKLATKQTKTWPTPANAELGTAQPQLVLDYPQLPWTAIFVYLG